MKNSIYILICLFLIVNTACKVELFSCLKGEGEIETRTVSVDAFTGIELNIAANIEITEGPEQIVQIEGHPNVIDRILEDSKIQRDSWEIDIDGCSNTEDLQFFITLPTLQKLSIKGVGNITSNGVFTNIEKVDLEIKGDGNINVQLGAVTKVDMEIKGRGEISVSGNTNDQSIDISGTGVIRNFGLKANTTRIDISGNGDCNVQTEDLLTIDFSGSGRVCYKGNPTLNFDTSGSGQVEDCN